MKIERIETKYTNYRIDMDTGEVICDSVIEILVAPNKTIEFIEINFNITKTMTIQEHIINDMKLAMREKNAEVRDLLRVVIGEFNREGKIVSDEKALSIIKKMHFNATEQNNTIESTILEKYLPVQMDELELKRVCMNFLMNMNITPSPKEMGKVMNFLKENHGGNYDGKMASNIVKELLS